MGSDHVEEEQKEEAKNKERAIELMDLPAETLSLIFSFLPPCDILTSISQVSGTFAKACEPCFEDLCKTRGWKMPRMPRGGAAEAKCFAWRSLFRQHVCENCGESGDFRVWSGWPTRANLLLCRRCMSIERVRARLEELDAFVYLVGKPGGKLLRKFPKKRKCRSLG